MSCKFVKVWWSSEHGTTAGLIFSTAHLRGYRGDIGKLSRLWPASEASRMERLHVSQDYETWEQAFAHEK